MITGTCETVVADVNMNRAAAQTATADFRGKRVLVLGMGTSGLAVARLLAAHGARVRITDKRTHAELGAAVSHAEEHGIRVETGGNTFWPEADLLVPSPGVPRDIPVYRQAVEAGLPILGEMEVGSRFCPVPLFGITGTNGKSTVVTMLDHILNKTNRPHRTGGNLDVPLSALVAKPGVEALEGMVLEISSYQLEAIDRFHPRAAAILNIAPDHLSRYRGVDEYAWTKWNITRNQTAEDTLLLPVDYPAHYTGETQARVLRFGEGTPAGDGVFHTNEVITVRVADVEEEVIHPEFARQLRHVRQNALAAVALARVWGVEAEAAVEALDDYRHLPHRIELCGEHNGVRYYNDSKATNIHAAVAALGSMERPVHILLGGSPKGEDFARLREGLRGNVRAAYTFGQTGPEIARAIAGAVDVIEAATLRDALVEAVRRARAGEGVLLSPACASFDEFRNFEDRGDRFREWVEELAS